MRASCGAPPAAGARRAPGTRRPRAWHAPLPVACFWPRRILPRRGPAGCCAPAVPVWATTRLLPGPPEFCRGVSTEAPPDAVRLPSRIAALGGAWVERALRARGTSNHARDNMFGCTGNCNLRPARPASSSTLPAASRKLGQANLHGGAVYLFGTSAWLLLLDGALGSRVGAHRPGIVARFAPRPTPSPRPAARVAR